MILGSYRDLKPSEPRDADEDAAAALMQYAVGTFVRDPYAGLTTSLGWPTYQANGKARTMLSRTKHITDTS